MALDSGYFEVSKPVTTNADRIRAMSDDELAKVLYEQSDSYCKNLPECGHLLDTPDGIPEEKCIGCALEWLKQPVMQEGDKCHANN